MRERGLVSIPKMEYQDFLCIFQKNSAMAILGFKKMEKFLWEGREKAIADFFWKMQRKSWYSILGLDAMPLSLKNLSLKTYYILRKEGNHAIFYQFLVLSFSVFKL